MYQCEFCGEIFTRLKAYQIHRAEHLKRPRHQCPHCSKSYLRKEKLDHHTYKMHLDIPEGPRTVLSTSTEKRRDGPGFVTSSIYKVGDIVFSEPHFVDIDTGSSDEDEARAKQPYIPVTEPLTPVATPLKEVPTNPTDVINPLTPTTNLSTINFEQLEPTPSTSSQNEDFYANLQTPAPPVDNYPQAGELEGLPLEDFMDLCDPYPLDNALSADLIAMLENLTESDLPPDMTTTSAIESNIPLVNIEEPVTLDNDIDKLNPNKVDPPAPTNISPKAKSIPLIKDRVSPPKIFPPYYGHWIRPFKMRPTCRVAPTIRPPPPVESDSEDDIISIPSVEMDPNLDDDMIEIIDHLSNDDE